MVILRELGACSVFNRSVEGVLSEKVEVEGVSSSTGDWANSLSVRRCAFRDEQGKEDDAHQLLRSDEVACRPLLQTVVPIELSREGQSSYSPSVEV